MQRDKVDPHWHISKDTGVYDLIEDIVLDGEDWRNKIHEANPQIIGI